MKVSTSGINLIKTFENISLVAYQDIAGVWTIGYGWTQQIDGKKIKKGMKITEQYAVKLLQLGIQQYELAVNDLVTAPLNQNQFDALVSLAYNIGINAMKNSTLLKKLNVLDYDGAAQEILKWNQVGGKVIRGLIHRREAEKKLFSS
jgi:GH24 family phage-related lysozyme (muramidase)